VDDGVSTYAKPLVRAAIFFAVMPYIGIGALPSDTQPVAFILAAVGTGLLLAQSRGRLAYLVLPLLVMAFLATVSFVLRGAFDDVGYVWLIRSYYGYVSAPVIVVFFLHYLPFLRNDDIARVIDVALVVTFAGFLLNVLGLTWIVQTVVNRALFSGAALGARGLPGFFAEPSRVSEQMAICFFCYLLTGGVTRVRVVALVGAAILAAAGQMFVVLAHIILAYGVASAILVLVRQGVSVRVATRLALAGVVIAAFVSFHQVIAVDLIRMGFPTRGITAMSRIVGDGRTYIGRDSGMMDKLAGVLQAGATVIDRPGTFKLAATADDEFPDTVRRTYGRLVQYLFDSQLLRFSRRPSTALGLWVLEFGVLGLTGALFYVGLLLWRAVRAPADVQLPALWTALFLVQVLFIKLALANPSLWLLSALVWVSASAQIRRSGYQRPRSMADGGPGTRTLSADGSM
jgi:hypothetical protein